jgi:hypothetical protein
MNSNQINLTELPLHQRIHPLEYNLFKNTLGGDYVLSFMTMIGKQCDDTDFQVWKQIFKELFMNRNLFEPKREIVIGAFAYRFFNQYFDCFGIELLSQIRNKLKFTYPHNGITIYKNYYPLICVCTVIQNIINSKNNNLMSNPVLI